MKAKRMKCRHLCLMVSIPLALSYWLLDSCIHYFVYGEFEFELIPSDFNELWMRFAILILLIGFGVFADHHRNQITQKDIQKRDVYLAMLSATKHILNNFLQGMLLFRDLADECENIDQELLDLYDQTINNAVDQVDNLNNIQYPSKENIRERFLPK